MKLWLSALFFLVGGMVSFGQQLPNRSFENWSLREEYIEPDGWRSTNANAYFGAVETCYPFEDAHSGKWAAKLETRIDPLTKDTLQAVLALGKDYESAGIPFNQRPTSLSLYYQHNLKDTAIAAAFLTKWNTQTNKRDTIATAYHFFTDNTTGYKALDMPFAYTQTVAPDTCIVVFLTSFKPKPNPTNFLLIDDLSLNGLVGVQELYTNAKVKVYPNPATDVLTIETKAHIESVSIFDMQGKQILKVKDNILTISSLKTGTYFVFVEFENGENYTSKFTKL